MESPDGKSRRVSLSVLVPVYNERYLVAESLGRLEILEQDPNLSRVEVIVVDDGSSDGTAETLARLAAERGQGQPGKITWVFVRHEKNLGKGAAVRTALARATGDVSIIHDADLEYDPADICRIMKAYIETDADAVFGSRFAGADVRRVLMFRHELGNKFLTFLCNLVANLNLTDVWTCYKAVRTSLLKSIPLASNDFRIEPEITIKIAKREARIFEVPIKYYGRTYREGKKINWKDGVLALIAIARFGASDEVYERDEYGSQILARLARAPRFNLWMADTVRPFCGDRILEIGSGVGNLSRVLVPRARYVASDINPLYLQTLRNLQLNRPYLSAAYCDVKELSSFPTVPGGYDTVICLNVLEHVENDRAALLNIKSVLSDRGRALILVPQGPWNYGTLDEVLGHCRRYTRDTLTRLAAECGLEVRTVVEFNRFGTIAWFLNGKLMRRRSFGLFQVWVLNLITPLVRRIDRFLPIQPLSLIAVFERAPQPAAGAEQGSASSAHLVAGRLR
ncbi:MAG: bifunctional glycosyltransferase/class I SAM-dependent methyltransferase [Candidatus Binataceae bacterium]